VLSMYYYLRLLAVSKFVPLSLHDALPIFNDDQVADKVSKAITDHVLPFVKRMRSRHDMVQWLMDTQVVKTRYPPPIINLAILQRSEEHTSELQSRENLVCRLLLEKKKNSK